MTKFGTRKPKSGKTKRMSKVFKVGDRVVWNGKGNEDRKGMVVYETWENGGYVSWDDGEEEPCYWDNLRFDLTQTN